MITETEFAETRKRAADYCSVLSRALLIAKTQYGDDSTAYISVELACRRLAHVRSCVAKSFNKTVHGRVGAYMQYPKTYQSLLNNKYTPTALAIAQLMIENKINLDRWILSQVKTIRMPHFTLYHCYGANAMSRYEGWEKKQEKTFARESEKAQVTNSTDVALKKSLTDSHLTALTHTDVLLSINAPSFSAALWYLWPSVSPWYLIAHAEFRTDILESGLCDDPMLVTRWKQYKRRPAFQKMCHEALQHVIETHGPVIWQQEQ